MMEVSVLNQSTPEIETVIFDKYCPKLGFKGKYGGVLYVPLNLGIVSLPLLRHVIPKNAAFKTNVVIMESVLPSVVSNFVTFLRFGKITGSRVAIDGVSSILSSFGVSLGDSIGVVAVEGGGMEKKKKPRKLGPSSKLTNQKPGNEACEICGKAGLFPSGLKNHLSLSHGGRKLLLPYCHTGMS